MEAHDEYIDPILQDGSRIDAAAKDGDDAPIIGTDQNGNPILGEALFTENEKAHG